MARLENEKLIGITPSGTVVLGITDQDVADMFTVKRALEPIVVKKAAMNISGEDLARLKEILDQQEFYEEKQNIEKVRNLDTQFHDIIYSASGSPIRSANSRTACSSGTFIPIRILIRANSPVIRSSFP